jgi:hypothetical protein
MNIDRRKHLGPLRILFMDLRAFFYRIFGR